MDEFSLEDALGPDASSAAKLNAGATNPQPGQPGQPGPWPQPGQPGAWPQPGQPGAWPQPGQPGAWPQPGQPGAWPQPGQPGAWPSQPGQPGQPGPWGPWPGQPGQLGPAVGPLTLPFEIPFQGGWIPGKMLTVEGTINMNIDKFAINVCAGQDIVFHFNVRFREDGHHQVIVRNSKFNNVWGNEERAVPHFPFRKGERFEILILGEPEQYKMAVNKQHFLEYRHRYKSLKEVTKVSIYGDITLHKAFMM